MQHVRGATATPQTVRLAAGMTVLEFIWNGDRWRHEVRTSVGHVWRSVEESAAPNNDPRWPASPVLMEVSVVEVAGRAAVLGIGLAGRSHFSLCVTVPAAQDNTLLFEAACRINAAAGRLGSTYSDLQGSETRIEPQWPPPVPPATVRWSYALGPDGPQPVPPARLAAGG